MQKQQYFDRVKAATLPQGTALSEACTAIKLSSIQCKATDDIVAYLTNNGAAAAVGGFNESLKGEGMKDYLIDQCIVCSAGSVDEVCQVRNSQGELSPPGNDQIGVMFAKMGGETDGRPVSKKIAIGVLQGVK